MTFDVTPEELKKSANRIITLKKEWIDELNSITAAINDLNNSSFEGMASSQFSKQWSEYLNDYNTAEKVLSEYFNFLWNYADKIQKAEDDLKQQASQLSTSVR